MTARFLPPGRLHGGSGAAAPHRVARLQSQPRHQLRGVRAQSGRPLRRPQDRDTEGRPPESQRRPGGRRPRQTAPEVRTETESVFGGFAFLIMC